MQSKFGDLKKIQEVLQEAQTGLWAIELESGKSPRMYVDSIMFRLLGLTGDPCPEECYRIWYDNIDEEYYPAVNECINKMKSENRAEVEYPWRHPKFGKIFIRCGGVRDSSYTCGICLRGYHQNITDLVCLRQEKKVLEELNYEILDTLQELFFAVYRIDLTEGTVRELRLPENEFPSMQEKMDYSLFLQQRVKKMYLPEDFSMLQKDFSLESLRFLSKQKSQKFAREYRRRFGTQYRWVSLTLSFGQGDARSKWGIVALQDIQLQKQREGTNRIAIEDAYHFVKGANNAKTDFLSKMSHDIRTPLSAILGMTTLAQANLNDTAKVQDCIEKIKVSGKLLMNLVDEILEMNRIENGNYPMHLSEFTMEELTESLLSMVMPMFYEKQQKFELNAQKRHQEILIGDMMRIQQVLMNILTNANKYTPVGGRIRFSIEEPSLNQGKSYRCFQFTIEDTGIGMSEEFLRQIFEPFARAEDSRISKVTGTGLGMTIAYNIVHLMGGTIEVESQLGKGSKFTVFLNFKKKEVSLEDAAKKKEEAIADIRTLNLEGVHFLLAEDNELNMEIAKEFLELSGAKVKAVFNGKEALEEFQGSEIGYYDIVFLDIQMPVMDGYQAARAIRGLSRSDAKCVPIMAMTANAFTEDVVMVKQAGMNEHIAKPIKLSRLSEVLQKYLGK